MKALVHTAPFQFELREVPDPQPTGKEVLIRVKAVGICGSDVHGMTGTTGRRIPPVVMGHEATGDVIVTGPEANSSWAGKRVTFDSTIYCGECAYCRRGQVNLCNNRRVLGVSCDEYRKDGAFAEFVVVPEHILYELPDSVSYEDGAMTEPLSVALHAVKQAEAALGGAGDPGGGSAPDAPGRDRALVIGCGVIGLLTIQSARALGYRTIIATDLSDRRLQAARACGAAVAVKPEALAAEAEVDVAFEAVGASPTVNAAIGKVRKGGTVVLIGNVASEVTFPLQTVVTRQIAVLGSCASSGEYAECLDLISSGKVNVAPLISEVVPLEQAAEYFHKLHESPNDYLKVVVRPGENNV